MSFQSGSAQTAVRLAAFFARPTGFLRAEDHLDPALAARLGERGAAGRARARMVSAALGFDRASFAEGFRDRLATRERCRHAVALALAPADRLGSALRHLAAAVYQNRLRSAVLKAEREAAVALLGDDAVQSGLRQAPVFAGALAALARREVSSVTPDAPLVAHAEGIAIRLAAAEDALLGRVLAARLPAAIACPALSADQETAAWRVLEGRV